MLSWLQVPVNLVTTNRSIWFTRERATPVNWQIDVTCLQTLFSEQKHCTVSVGLGGKFQLFRYWSWKLKKDRGSIVSWVMLPWHTLLSTEAGRFTSVNIFSDFKTIDLLIQMLDLNAVRDYTAALPFRTNFPRPWHKHTLQYRPYLNCVYVVLWQARSGNMGWSEETRFEMRDPCCYEYLS